MKSELPEEGSLHIELIANSGDLIFGKPLCRDLRGQRKHNGTQRLSRAGQSVVVLVVVARGGGCHERVLFAVRVVRSKFSFSKDVHGCALIFGVLTVSDLEMIRSGSGSEGEGPQVWPHQNYTKPVCTRSTLHKRFQVEAEQLWRGSAPDVVPTPPLGIDDVLETETLHRFTPHVPRNQ